MTRQILAVFAALAMIAPQAFGRGGAGGGGGGGGGGGAGGGGGGTAVNPLPTTPPAPDVVLRESFGPGLDPTFARPQGGNGNLRNIFAGTGLNDFWVEYPGSKSTIWATPETKGWDFSFASLNPFETLASPIQPNPFNGVIFSDWTDGVVTSSDALLPFRGVSTQYSVSAELYPGTLPGAYVGFGLTSSGSLQSNLPANGQIWIRLFQVAPFSGIDGNYEVRIGNQVLASGAVILDGFNPVSITVDPLTEMVSVSLKGVDLGTWGTRVSSSFIALEGQGWADDLVVRKLP